MDIPKITNANSRFVSIWQSIECQALVKPYTNSTIHDVSFYNTHFVSSAHCDYILPVFIERIHPVWSYVYTGQNGNGVSLSFVEILSWYAHTPTLMIDLFVFALSFGICNIHCSRQIKSIFATNT